MQRAIPAMQINGLGGSAQRPVERIAKMRGARRKGGRFRRPSAPPVKLCRDLPIVQNISNDRIQTFTDGRRPDLCGCGIRHKWAGSRSSLRHGRMTGLPPIPAWLFLVLQAEADVCKVSCLNTWRELAKADTTRPVHNLRRQDTLLTQCDSSRGCETDNKC